MRVFALVTAGSTEAIDLYLRRDDAERDVAAVAEDDVELAADLTVVEFDFERLFLDGARFSLN